METGTTGEPAFAKQTWVEWGKLDLGLPRSLTSWSVAGAWWRPLGAGRRSSLLGRTHTTTEHRAVQKVSLWQAHGTGEAPRAPWQVSGGSLGTDLLSAFGLLPSACVPSATGIRSASWARILARLQKLF